MKKAEHEKVEPEKAEQEEEQVCKWIL